MRQRLAICGILLAVPVLALCVSVAGPEESLDREISPLLNYSNVSCASAEATLTELAEKYNGDEQSLAQVYYLLAEITSCRGGREYSVKVPGYCAEALKYPQPVEKRMLLYTWWGGTLFISNLDSNGNATPASRRIAAEACLKGIKDARDSGLPQEVPPMLTFADFPELYRTYKDENGVEQKIPIVGNTIVGDDPASVAAKEQEDRRRSDLYRQIEERKNLVEAVTQSKRLEDEVVYIYSFAPNEAGDLRQLASEIVANATLAENLAEEVKRAALKREIERRASELLSNTLEN